MGKHLDLAPVNNLQLVQHLPVCEAPELIDPFHFCDVRVDRCLGFLLSNLGTPGNTAIHKYMNQKKVPQLFVTSGAGGLYRPGIAVAIVTRLTDDGAVARIISNPAATDFVAVEPLWQPEALRGAETPIEEAIGSNETVQQESDDDAPEAAEQGGVITP